MTTIAVRDGTIAADTQISYRTFHNGNASKIANCGGYYVALSGLGFIRRPLEKWVEDGCDVNAIPHAMIAHNNEFSALLMDGEGNVFEYDNGYLMPIVASYAAIGSGGSFALGAMAHGASAVEAVQAASLHDLTTGGDLSYAHFSALNS